MRIIYSWCQELDEVITIDSARRYFLSEEPPRNKYHFFCADPHCAEPAVRISGVNYKTAALDTVKQKAAHFREWDKHDQQCIWVQQDQSEDKPIDESADAIKQRHLRRKLSDFINVFDPRVDYVGLFEWQAAIHGTDLSKLLKVADDCLYLSKQNGAQPVDDSISRCWRRG